MILTELDGGTVIHRLSTPEDIERWRPGFIGAYQTVFAGFPYFERFYPDEAQGIYKKLTSAPNNITLLATRGDQVQGFGVGIPLTSKRSVANQMTGLVPLQHTFYLAELGVLPEYRGQQIGRTLVRERLRFIDPDCYSHVVLRISTNTTPSSEMYRAMGFTEMGVYMNVNSLRTDGQVNSDRRLFMSRMLSQVDLDGLMPKSTP